MIGVTICCYAVMAALSCYISSMFGWWSKGFSHIMNRVTIITAVLGLSISIVEFVIAVM